MDDRILLDSSVDNSFISSNVAFNSAIKNEEEEYSDSKQLKQVEISMLRVDWLTGEKNGLKFLSRMGRHECLPLFQCQTLKDITLYLWKSCRTFFIYQYFLPYLLLCFMPLIAVCNLTERNPETDVNQHHILFYLSLSLFTLGTVLVIYEEIHEIIKSSSMRKYMQD